MKTTGLAKGDRLMSPGGNSIVTVLSEDNGLVQYSTPLPGRPDYDGGTDATNLLGWTLLTDSNMPKGTQPEKREAFEDIALPIQGGYISVSETLNAYFASGWSFVDLTYYPQGAFLAILRRRAVGIQSPKAGG